MQPIATANADHANDHLQKDPKLASAKDSTQRDNQQKVDQEKPPTMYQRDTPQGEAYRKASVIPVANPPKSANASAVPKNEEDPEAIWSLLNQLNQRAQDAGSQRLAEPAMKSSEPSYGARDSKREASQTSCHPNSTPADGPISNAPDDRTSSTQTYQDPNSPEGRRPMIRAIGAQDQAALEQWIQAGGNALKTVGKGQSAMALALTHWPKGAQMLANRLPSDATANPDKQGNTEIHLAIQYPEILNALLRSGLRDSCNANGMTALMMAAEQGYAKSVEYLLKKDTATNEDFYDLSYVNTVRSKDELNAFDLACINQHTEVAKLLLGYGAKIKKKKHGQSLVALAVSGKNIELLKLLLSRGAGSFETGMDIELMTALQKKWVEGVLELGRYVTLRPDYQTLIWKEWALKPFDETMLSVISTIIQPDYPTEQNLMNNPDFLKIPFKSENSNLMKPMLNFFAGRASLSFAVRTFTKELIGLHDEPRRSKMAKQLIAFACKHFDDLEDDKDVIMYLLKLSDHIKDYSILTTINAIHVNQRTRFSKEQLPIKKDWVSDPVALEFISAKRRPGRKEKVAGTFSKISSLVTGTTHKRKIDSMQFIDHLALALQSDSVGLALDRTFETYHLSAVLRQALKPFLEQLITALYPEPKDRSESVCRMLIGYALSTLSLNPLLVQSPAMALMKSDKHWHFMKEKVGQELEAIDRISATTLQYAPRIANLIQVDTIVQLILEAWEDPDREEALLQSFRSKLGLLDVPAQQLAQASMKAGLIWKMSSTSSTNAGAEDDPEANLGQLKSLIWDELKTLEKRPMITASLAKNLLTSELNLIDVYQDLVSQQIDLIRDAFKRETGTDANHSSSIVSASEDGVEQKETEKENEKS